MIFCCIGFYGFSLLESCRYVRTSFAVESSLARREDGPGRIKALVLVGVQHGVNKEGKTWVELYYMVTRDQDSAKMQNLSQIGASILSSSRVRFYSILLRMLNLLDPDKAHLAYCDTGKLESNRVGVIFRRICGFFSDSAYFHTSTPELRDCVPDELKPLFDASRQLMLEDPKAAKHQSGLLKLEGKFRAGYFRAMKSYFLVPECEEEKPYLRAKGVKKSVREKMDKSHFKMKEEKKSYFQSFRLAPTQGGEIQLMVNARRNVIQINPKRWMGAVGRV